MPTRPVVSVLAALVLAGGAAMPAAAQDTDTSTGIVTLAVRSISVDINGFDFDECFTPEQLPTGNLLTFPHGTCFANPIAVTNGSQPAVIHAHATAFVGSEGGDQWELCGSTPAPACPFATGGGVDQARLDIGTVLLNSSEPRCLLLGADPDECVTSGSGESTLFGPAMTGPIASTGSSPKYATTITWSALPPEP